MTRARIVLVGLLAGVLLVVPASGYGKGSASQLEVFSWWTGGGEAHGLDALIKIWNKAHPTMHVKNSAVAGGAGTNAKAVLAQRLAAKKPPDSFQGHAGAELQDYIKANQLEIGFAVLEFAKAIQSLGGAARWNTPVDDFQSGLDTGLDND